MVANETFDQMQQRMLDGPGGEAAFKEYLHEMARAARKDGNWGAAHSAKGRGALSGHWGTPDYVLEEVQEILEALDLSTDFVLDVAADPGTAVASDYFGLFHPDPARRNSLLPDLCWTPPVPGAVWENPPYDIIEQFAKKTAEYKSPLVDGVPQNPLLFLAFARTDVKWFHDYVIPNSPYMWMRKGRIKFIDPIDPDVPNGAPAPSFLGLFGVPSEYVTARINKVRCVGRWQLVRFF